MNADSHSMTAQVDVIVIGAGVSGLAAAAKLTAEGHRVLVLEARDRIGGRIDSHLIGKEGDKVDMGASFVHGRYDNPVHDLATELQIPMYDAPPQNVPMSFDPDGEVKQDALNYVQMNVLSSFFEHSSQASASGDPPYSASLGSYLYAEDSPLYDGLSVDQGRFRAMCLARALSGWPGADLEDVSLRWWGFERDTLGPDRLVTSGRYADLAEHLARDCDIRLGMVVQKIRWKQEEGKVEVSANGNTYLAPHVVCTLPLGVLKQSPTLFEPLLPPRKSAAIGRLGFGLLSKVALRYEYPWWSKTIQTSSIFLFPTANDPAALHPPGIPLNLKPQAVMVQNFERIDGSPQLVFFFSASYGRALESGDPQITARWADALIKKYIAKSQDNLPEPTQGGALVSAWADDPFSFGAYTYIPPFSGQDGAPCTPLDLAEFARPIWNDALGFAGEHTHQNRYASVHGAYESGIREATRLGVALRCGRSL